MSRPRVALFATCLVDRFLPEVGVAAVCLLRRAGFAVDFPEDQNCCGQPFANSGFHREARRLARRTVEVFEPYDAVVLPGGSCASMLCAEYPRLFEDDPDLAVRARALGAKTFELTRFLVYRSDWRPPRAAGAPRVTYHDSCHMLRSLGVRDEPRELLAAAGCTLAEMEESDRCCGFGGIFSVRMPEISHAMTAAKLRRARASGAEVLVSSDPGCLLQMRGLRPEGLRVEHTAVLLAGLLDAEPAAVSRPAGAGA